MGVYKSFSVQATGGSHTKLGLPCQDAVGHKDSPDLGLSMAVVADGHGEENCFRSDRGSYFAVQCATEHIREYVKSYNQRFNSGSAPSRDELRRALDGQLVPAIVNSWNMCVHNDSTNNPFTQAELAKCGQRYRELYMTGQRLKKAYGTSLIAAAITRDFWFGIHIGDGRFTVLYPSGKGEQPVPWDPKCYLNVTSSVCDDDVLTRQFGFRTHLALHSEAQRPAAVYLCSDGIDDNYPVDENEKHLYRVYREISVTFAESGFESTCAQLDRLAAQFASRGKADDTSIAGFIDLDVMTKELDRWKRKIAQADAERATEQEAATKATMLANQAYEDAAMKRMAQQPGFDPKLTFNPGPQMPVSESFGISGGMPNVGNPEMYGQYGQVPPPVEPVRQPEAVLPRPVSKSISKLHIGLIAAAAVGVLGVGVSAAVLAACYLGWFSDEPESGFVSLSAGNHHTVAVDKNGLLWSWGSNESGQLGDDWSSGRERPGKVEPKSKWLTASAGYCHTVAIKTDGTLWGWGCNRGGQLGRVSAADVNSPSQFGDDGLKYVQVSAGGFHTVAVTEDGVIHLWGSNGSFQLGHSDKAAKSNSINMSDVQGYVAVSAGFQHTTALSLDGRLFTWGNNDHGQVGNGSYDAPNKPFPIADSRYKSVSAGAYHTAAVGQDGSLWIWGGALPVGRFAQEKPKPIQVGTDKHWKSVSAGDLHTLAVKDDGTIWAWGDNYNGQIGDRSAARSAPHQLKTPQPIREASAGSRHSAAIASDGSILAWGSNNYGQVGSDTASIVDTPKPITSVTNAGTPPAKAPAEGK
ncbi:MAG: protein phosphatase 2C domain-containing protein [Polyangiaceae bacterium]|nr:protein phosphatase 2C domain-containing protein [Polyangiaceae bacterium]